MSLLINIKQLPLCKKQCKMFKDFYTKKRNASTVEILIARFVLSRFCLFHIVLNKVVAIKYETNV